MAKHYEQGKFRPSNPGKYRGDVDNIVYRSSWERRFMRFCDECPGVIEWSSEEIVIPYVCPTDGQPHRYFPDFWLRVLTKSGGVEERLVEIKPKSETLPPKPTARKTKRYVEEALKYAKNNAKWEAAREMCKRNNWTFHVLTEDSVTRGRKGGRR